MQALYSQQVFKKGSFRVFIACVLLCIINGRQQNKLQTSQYHILTFVHLSVSDHRPPSRALPFKQNYLGIVVLADIAHDFRIQFVTSYIISFCSLLFSKYSQNIKFEILLSELYFQKSIVTKCIYKYKRVCMYMQVKAWDEIAS
jgi:hypothetical protein